MIASLIRCEASEEEKRVAQSDHVWWKQTLGPFYSGFFDEMSNQPKPNFRKIMHIHVTDALIARYKEVKFVWAHMGLSMELTQVRLPPIAFLITMSLDSWDCHRLPS